MYNHVHMKHITYVNLIEISPVAIEIQQVENGNLKVPVNNMTGYLDSCDCSILFL